jgi:CRISPR-associated endonuclease Cas2
MVTAAETFCLVVYDVPDDGIRGQFSETCLDYGLERFQMSAFWGYLSASRRKELFVKLCEFLARNPGRVLVQPIGAEDVERRYVLHQKAVPQSENKDGEPVKRHRDFPEPGVEKPTIIKLR